jgi:hypothetical protein
VGGEEKITDHTDRTDPRQPARWQSTEGLIQMVSEQDRGQMQEAVQNLRDAFNDIIEMHERLGIDPDAFEKAKQDIIGQIIDACPDADPGTFVQLADGSWTTVAKIRKQPESFIQKPDGRWAVRDAANVETLKPPEEKWWQK